MTMKITKMVSYVTICEGRCIVWVHPFSHHCAVLMLNLLLQLFGHWPAEIGSRITIIIISIVEVFLGGVCFLLESLTIIPHSRNQDAPPGSFALLVRWLITPKAYIDAWLGLEMQTTCWGSASMHASKRR